MNYKTPFYAANLAIYQSLTKDGKMDWFDSSVPVFEIDDYFRKQEEFCYGIIGAEEADCTPNDDMVLWTVSTNLEVYSNYKGRKVIALKLEELLNFFSSQEGWDALQDILHANGFNLWGISVGRMRMNMPMYSEKGIWQSGGTDITLKMTQLEK